MPRHLLWSLRLILAAMTLLAVVPSKAQALTCSGTVTNINFGAPNLLDAAPVDVMGTLTVTCTSIPIATVVKLCAGIDAGSGGASGSARLLTGPSGNTLSYQLYQDASRTQAWGSLNNPNLGTVPAMSLNGGLTGTDTATRTIYARLFSGQSAMLPGAYSSSFTGTQVVLTYAPYLLVGLGSCVGFVGTQNAYPTFTATATPGAGCNLTTADLTFPSAGVLSNAVSGQTSLTVACTRNTPYSISLDNGQTGTAPTARKMKSAAGNTLTYGLYRDTGRSQIWGTAAASQGVTGTGSGSSVAVPVYGQVPAQSTPAPGVYTDRIVATIAY
jgi:spore coat protein U-like protein